MKCNQRELNGMDFTTSRFRRNCGSVYMLTSVSCLDGLFFNSVGGYQGNQIMSSLSLQMALYFNVWAFPFWFVVRLGFLFEECCCLSKAYKYIHIVVLLLVSLMEGTRLYFGYRGNLSEKIPELACFWLISTLLQFPLQLYVFCNERILPSVWYGIADGIVMILLVVEIVAGTVTLRNIANHYASKFYLAQLYGINDQSEEKAERA